jgi:ABC-type lipoprotein release transport system permease subunit
MNPRILGIRLSMLVYLYRRRLRAHPVGELLAGSGVAIGVALVFGVLLTNASLTSSASTLIHGLTGSARLALVARSSQGFDQRLAERAGSLPGVQVAAPVLRENVTLIAPRSEEAVQLIGVSPSLEALGGLATQQYAEATVLLKGGLGLPSGMARALGARPDRCGWRATACPWGAVSVLNGGASRARRRSPWRSRCSESPRRSPSSPGG